MRQTVYSRHGDFAISPRGDKPKYRARIICEGATMSSYTTKSPDKLSRLIGTAHMPALIDVRTEEDFAADPRLIPGAVRRRPEQAPDWGEAFSGRSAIVV